LETSQSAGGGNSLYKLNAIRRRYQRTKHDNNLREARKYQHVLDKREYEAALRKAKVQSWKQYRNVTTSSNPWNAVYKLASGKIKSRSLLSTLKKPKTDLMDTAVSVPVSRYYV
jgi:hypothetical protein